MMCIILLLINLTSCVCGTFVVNVTQTSYQAEENHNITLEWMFTTKTGSSLHSLYIYCELLTDLRASGLFRLHGGVEVPESQDEQFTGRVQCDKDVLREGRLRLHVSRLRTDDSGLYMCSVFTKYGRNSATCRLNVTAAADEPRPQRPTESPQPESWKMIVLYVGLTAAALLTLCVILYVAYFRICREKRPLSHTEVHVTDALNPDCNQKDTIGVILLELKVPLRRGGSTLVFPLQTVTHCISSFISLHLVYRPQNRLQ
ncbi:uncharacterized protein LOC125884182 isoform X3 [Epinephelus fuscoguttatus]|uniref:uncharacterized protein LOC125884182 isoform X2 n=1 Tax=Epinephelus fuscoguttatus TaxID=293821 RepID=UPI0020D16DD7|nr:uncharacterized protein LOC125884182 isoform X2 [Epinephelus fuscoguttatus]XP_049424984.1 uncharacterized protein LOC125884182 isoform X3 [Epinephelus fuscoguttatus]